MSGLRTGFMHRLTILTFATLVTLLSGVRRLIKQRDPKIFTVSRNVDSKEGRMPQEKSVLCALVMVSLGGRSSSPLRGSRQFHLMLAKTVPGERTAPMTTTESAMGDLRCPT